MKTYIEIRKYENDKCVKRIDVTGKTQRQIDKIENGMNINLNHEEYYTKEVLTQEPLQEIAS